MGAVVQTEKSNSSTPIDFESLYSQAVITMCWRVTPPSKDPNLKAHESYRQLIVATVELIPKYWDLLTPKKVGERGIKVDGHRVYFLRRILSCKDAVEWYKAALENNYIRIGDAPSCRIFFKPHNNEEFSSLEYPQFPNTVFLSNSPIVPACWQYAQAHHCWPSHQDKDMNSYLADVTISDWINTHLCWNLNDNIEYIGSLNFIAPNPYYYRSFCRISPSMKSDSKEQVTISFDRNVADFGLEISFAERFNTEIGELRLHPINSETMTFTLNGKADETGYIIFDKDGRIWDMSPFSHVIRKISIKFGVVGSPHIFRCKDGTEQRTEHVEDLRLLSIGSEPDDIPELALAHRMVEMRRSQELTKKPRSQFLFFKEEADAEKRIRTIINSAEESICIVDPYFSYETAKLFIDARQSARIAITILCTRKGFEDNQNENDEEELLNFQKILTEVESDSIKVFVANQNLLHDRFVIIDTKDVWLLGSSLNSIGEALSVIVKLDDQKTKDKAIEVINVLVSSANPFDKWLQSRRNKCSWPAIIRLIGKCFRIRGK